MTRLLSVAMVFVCVCVSVMCEATSNSMENLFSNNEWGSVGRTLGHHALKRLAFIFLPVMFTLGVISTLLLAIAVISVKNLAVGVILLIVGISQAISRLFIAAPAPAPLVHYTQFPRSEPSFAAPWPVAPAHGLSPWGRSDDVGANIAE